MGEDFSDCLPAWRINTAGYLCCGENANNIVHDTISLGVHCYIGGFSKRRLFFMLVECARVHATPLCWHPLCVQVLLPRMYSTL